MWNVIVVGLLIAVAAGTLVAWIWIGVFTNDDCPVPLAVKKLRYTTVDNSTGKLSWEPPDDDSIKTYSIKVSSALKNLPDTYETDDTFLVVHDIEPCLKYKFVVDAVTEKRFESVSLFKHTPVIKPPEPTNFSFSLENKTLKWMSPCCTQCIEGYQLKFFHEGTCIKEIWLNKDTKQYNFSDINVCSSYRITLQALGKDLLKSDLVEKSISPTILDYSSHTFLRNLRYTKVQNDSDLVLLEWNVPQTDSSCVHDFMVSIPGVNEVPYVMLFTNTTNLLIPHLKPCIEYRIAVMARTAYGELIGKPADILVRTSSLENQIENISFSEKSHDLVVKWNAPIVTIDCAALYSLDICALDVNTPCRSFTPTVQKESSALASAMIVLIPDIIACATYKITVSVTKFDKGHAFHSEIYRSKPKVFDAPVFKKILALTSTSVSVEWGFRDATKNRCLLINSMLECTPDGNSFMSYEYLASRQETAGNGVHTNVNNLLPYTNYSCCASFYQEGTKSEKSKTVEFMTLEDAPSPVENVSLVEGRSEGFTLKWDPPKLANGILTGYRVNVRHTRSLYEAPSWCNVEEKKPQKRNLRAADQIYEVAGLEPFQEYKISISAATSVGAGAAKEVTITTFPAVPEAVSQSQYTVLSPHTGFVTWKQPCRCNGLLEVFIVTVLGTRVGHPDETYFYSIKPNKSHPEAVYSVKLQKLLPVYNYKIQISAKVNGVNESGNVTTLELSTPPSLPPAPEYEKLVRKVQPETVVGQNGTRCKVSLQKDVFEDSGGDILYYAVIVGQDISFNKKTEQGTWNVLKEWPSMNSYKEASQYDFIFPYQVTPPYWNPFKGSSSTERVDFIIGKDVVCDTPSSGFCNGPLKPETKYCLKIRAFTAAGYQDSTALTFITGSEIENVARASYLLVICVLVFVGFLVSGLYYVRTRHIPIFFEVTQRMNGKRRLALVPTKSIPVKAFIDFYTKLQQSPHILKIEFNELNEISIKYMLPDNVAKRYDNYRKNRYVNIVPYDETRVKINTDRGDYINASFIQGHKESSGDKARYIACQGPLVETFADFWLMILQYDISIIVMLCQIMENKRTVCEKYFPDVNETLTFCGITVECTIMTSNSLFEERKIIVTNDDKELTVSHIKFLEWPDFGIPSDPEILVDFCNAVRKRWTDKPIVVHCSAGVGRTGTFIACDILLQQLAKNKYVNIFNTVLQLRKQRPGMVQSIAQYSYLYECVYHRIKRNMDQSKK